MTILIPRSAVRRPVTAPRKRGHSLLWRLTAALCVLFCAVIGSQLQAVMDSYQAVLADYRDDARALIAEVVDRAEATGVPAYELIARSDPESTEAVRGYPVLSVAAEVEPDTSLDSAVRWATRWIDSHDALRAAAPVERPWVWVRNLDLAVLENALARYHPVHPDNRVALSYTVIAGMAGFALALVLAMPFAAARWAVDQAVRRRRRWRRRGTR